MKKRYPEGRRPSANRGAEASRRAAQQRTTQEQMARIQERDRIEQDKDREAKAQVMTQEAYNRMQEYNQRLDASRQYPNGVSFGATTMFPQYMNGMQNKQAPVMPEPQQAGTVQGGLVPVMRNGGTMSERDMMRADMIRDAAQQRAQHNYLQYFGDQQEMPMYSNGVRKFKGGGTVSGVGNVMGGVGGLMSLYGNLSGDQEVSKWGTAVSGVGSAVATTGNAMQQQEARNANAAPETDGDSIKKSMPAPPKMDDATAAKRETPISDMDTGGDPELQLTPEQKAKMDQENRLRWGTFSSGRNGSASIMAKYGCYMKGDANGRVKKR